MEAERKVTDAGSTCCWRGSEELRLRRSASTHVTLNYYPTEVKLTKTIYSAIFKFPLKGHVVIANENSDAIKLALGKLPLIPAETPRW